MWSTKWYISTTNQMPFSNSMLKILFNHNSFLMSNNSVSLSCRGCFVIKEPVNCISIQLTQWSTSICSNLPQNAVSRPWLRSGAVLWRLLNLFVWLNVVSWHASVYSPETIDICDVRQVFLSVSDIDDKPKRLFRVIPCPCEVPNDIFRRPTKCHFPTPCSKSVQSQFIF